MHNEKNQTIPKRTYRKITPEVIAQFKAAKIRYGSGAAAIRVIEPDETDPRRRAWLISTKCKQTASDSFLGFQLEHIGIDAINRIGEMVNSSDERIATKNSHYVIDQVRGMPTRHNNHDVTKLTIESIL
jgi:hypothetical protein